MRWSNLFADLEAQLAHQEQAQLAAEVAERTRAERGQVALAHRLVAAVGEPVRLRLMGAGPLVGHVADVGLGWLVLRTAESASGAERSRLALVPMTAVLAVSGLPVRADPREGAAARRLDLRHALRALARDRATLQLTDVSGGQLTGTIDRVGADHLELSEHPDDLPRRAAQVQHVTSMPFAAVAMVRQR